jgi:hypothetical protein
LSSAVSNVSLHWKGSSDGALTPLASPPDTAEKITFFKGETCSTLVFAAKPFFLFRCWSGRKVTPESGSSKVEAANCILIQEKLLCKQPESLHDVRHEGFLASFF